MSFFSVTVYDHLIEQIVTIVACENGETQIVIEKPGFYRERLESVIDEFHKIRTNEIKC